MPSIRLVWWQLQCQEARKIQGVLFAISEQFRIDFVSDVWIFLFILEDGPFM
jgi:hypothetical protein